MTEVDLADAETAAVAPPRRSRGGAVWLTVAYGIAGVVAAIAVWEGHKALGPAAGVSLGDTLILPRTNDRAMPHVADMVARLFEPTSGGATPPLWVSVASALATTLATAAVGWVIGVAVGLGLGVAMQRWRLVEWGLLPWIVVSQIVPLIAFAPVVNAIGNQIDRGGFPWPQWLSVAVIASYLAFFPVAVGTLRGLSSPDALHLDLFRAYAATPLETLRSLRFPSAVPYLLPALRLAAANAVVGAVVAEVSIGLRGGLGRMLIQLAGQASSDPPAPWGPLFGAVVLGLVAAASVALVGAGLRTYLRGEQTA